MKQVEVEARILGVSKIRLHVFYSNQTARRLYASMGYQVSDLEMVKSI